MHVRRVDSCYHLYLHLFPRLSFPPLSYLTICFTDASLLYLRKPLYNIRWHHQLSHSEKAYMLLQVLMIYEARVLLSIALQTMVISPGMAEMCASKKCWQGWMLSDSPSLLVPPSPIPSSKSARLQNSTTIQLFITNDLNWNGIFCICQ